jgi:pSer/pThr/pTyr-binding forkhead associated (FHA) protein
MWRERAALERTPEGVTVRELTPSAALLVNGERVAGARPLREGDVLQFGGTSLRFHDPAERYLAKLEAAPDEAERRPQPRPARARAAMRPEWLLAGAGLAIALAAAAGLVWVLKW